MDVVLFADFYAQTIAYGMFIARINDKTPESFSRLEAVELIPNGYPFLKEMSRFSSYHALLPVPCSNRQAPASRSRRRKMA